MKKKGCEEGKEGKGEESECEGRKGRAVAQYQSSDSTQTLLLPLPPPHSVLEIWLQGPLPRAMEYRGRASKSKSASITLCMTLDGQPRVACVLPSVSLLLNHPWPPRPFRGRLQHNMVDVDMKAAVPDAAATATSTSPKKEPITPKELVLLLLRHNLHLIVRSVIHLEPRFAARAVRTVSSTRKLCHLHPDVLARVVEEGTEKGEAGRVVSSFDQQKLTPCDPSSDSSIRAHLLTLLPTPYIPAAPSPKAAVPAPDSMELDTSVEAPTDSAKKAKDAVQDTTFKFVPQAALDLNAYLSLLVIVYSLDNGKVEQALELSKQSLAQIQLANKRTLDQVAARTAFYLARCLELLKAQGKGAGLSEERPFLLSLHRTATLRHDVETNATLQNLLLRSYIVESNLYDQADKLVARAPFPRGQASNGQIARYEYYVGRIRAVQLNYTEAHTHLQQAIRRAPQATSPKEEKTKVDAKGDEEKTPTSAEEAQATLKAELAKAEKTTPGAGFLQTAYKFLVVVELLMGDIPERSIFRMEILKKALSPYMEIVQAVRIGDLSLFSKTLSTHNALFQADKTHSLILRLRHNVIKTGIRTISLAYSRISLSDITKKLHLESEEDAEYIVAKAIRDGVIEAQVNHERGEMTSKETGDVYSTNEPQAQLRQRINFCLQLHNESVKAMRYPLNSHKAEMDSASAARERERELAKGIADGDISDEDEDWA